MTKILSKTNKLVCKSGIFVFKKSVIRNHETKNHSDTAVTKKRHIAKS